MKSRADSLRAIESNLFDVCVIGGGATGSGCALDAQLRGLRTALIDAGDFASATSSASTKLAHGGVRYLQQAFIELDPGQLKVVWEALRERARMLENAPHLAHPRQFLVPCFTRTETLCYGAGLKLYDLLAGQGNLEASRMHSPSEASAILPTLATEGLAGAVSYVDGQFDDARFCLSVVKSFSEAGGEVANYLRAAGFERGADGRLTAANVVDAFSGDSSRVRARVFVNATGPFSDHVRSMANPQAASRLILSRGAHILLPLTEGITTALLIPRTEDGRVIFAIPWLGRLLVGTTDDEVAAADQCPPVTRVEAEYLLRHLNRYSRLRYGIDDVVSAFSGVRPLVRASQSRQTKKLIRSHEVEVDSSGLVSILGGKWTTYRAMAEDAIDAAQKQLGNKGSSKTRHHVLSGGDGYSSSYWKLLVTKYGLSEKLAQHLTEKFGTNASAIADLTARNPELKECIVPGVAPILAEIVYCVREEMAVSLEDVLARRIGMQNFSWNFAMQAAPVVAAHLARELGWSGDQKERATSEYVGKIGRQAEALGFTVDKPSA